MGERFGYFVWDTKRNRECFEFDAFGDEVAKREFSGFYNERIGTARWETRKFGRYVLFRVARYVNGRRELIEDPPVVMEDDEVRLSAHRWFHEDPPGSDAEFDEDQREFDRLNALDEARLARRRNQAA